MQGIKAVLFFVLFISNNYLLLFFALKPILSQPAIHKQALILFLAKCCVYFNSPCFPQYDIKKPQHPSDPPLRSPK